MRNGTSYNKKKQWPSKICVNMNLSGNKSKAGYSMYRKLF